MDQNTTLLENFQNVFNLRNGSVLHYQERLQRNLSTLLNLNFKSIMVFMLMNEIHNSNNEDVNYIQMNHTS